MTDEPNVNKGEMIVYPFSPRSGGLNVAVVFQPTVSNRKMVRVA